ncbi:hypothetical protein D0T90_08820 [Neisseria animalis]|uniref:Uncharacterized protein n=1 Tax=Neisseria animalis TaxID=492 RepID=A0A5P3MSW9_NEIAN|nr:hypothetical protein D0T90_08820 [Neisseria animalis]ROW33033.1 hypothetical protein CGZ60_01900 [Neisseria animalis]
MNTDSGILQTAFSDNEKSAEKAFLLLRFPVFLVQCRHLSYSSKPPFSWRLVFLRLRLYGQSGRYDNRKAEQRFYGELKCKKSL